jgi:UDP-galactopyranose mutase
MDEFDLVVVGAGLAGCVMAERAANLLGWSVLIIEKRSHVGGLCFDRVHESGVLIHEHGPHYYRTNSRAQLEYLSAFTDWIDGRYIVKSLFSNKLYPMPINLTTLEMFFGRKLTKRTAGELLNRLRENIERPSNSEEQMISTIGRELYEAFFLNYTLKHWALHPRDLDASVCARIPIRLNRDERYVDHRFQKMPAKGYTKLFERMTSSSKIKIVLDCDFRTVRNELRARKATVYTGALDEYFDHDLGRLPYRATSYEHIVHNVELAQPCVQINCPNDFEHTRSLEYKHVTGQQLNHTLISLEYSSNVGEPAYPIPSKTNEKLANLYRERAQIERDQHVYFVGRLAEHRYLNMDEVIERSLVIFNEIAQRFSPSLLTFNHLSSM